MTDSRRSSTSSVKSDVKSDIESPALSSDQGGFGNTLDQKAQAQSQEQPSGSQPTSTIPNGIPNGGFTAWLQVLSGFMCFMSAWGMVNAFGVFQDFYSSTLIPDAVAMGIAASGSSFGGVIFPIIFRRLEPQIGFGWATRVIGFISLATLLVPCFCIKARAFPKSRRKLLDFAAFKEPAYALFSLASFVGFVGLYVPFFYISTYARDVSGLEDTLSFYMLPMMSAGSIAGRIIPGLVADKVGALNVLGFCNLCASILGFCWIAIHHTAGGLIIWALLYGALSGAFVSLQPTTVASITEDLSTVGGRMGLLVGSGNWVGMQVFSGATLLGAAILVIVTRISVTGLDVSVKA
ncbi:unnamed protein product [Aureobasidium mustum]|uniref:MFS general substrate transporter n=1 Tax=Aureobasidium mustum TaxID=2773714 RepID=A0A9N8K1D0_9PEZI|nr:unnamed protein product [Aureobasidium mustum]